VIGGFQDVDMVARVTALAAALTEGLDARGKSDVGVS
jgi:hypothetical protein